MRRRSAGVVMTAVMVTTALAGCVPELMEVTAAVPKTKTAPTGDPRMTEITTAAASTADLPILRVAVMLFPNSILTKCMIDNGLDVANKFKIDTMYFANGRATNEALAANEWGVGTLSAAAVNSLTICDDYCITDVGHFEDGLYTLRKPDSPTAKVKGASPSHLDVYGDAETLKGVIIATNIGTISHLNVIKQLEKLGPTTEGAEIVHMDSPSAHQALMTDNRDVAALNPSASYVIGGEDMVVTSSLANLDVPQFDPTIVNGKAFNEKRGALVSYTKTFSQVTDTLQTDPDMVAQLLPDWYTEGGSEPSVEAYKTEIEVRLFAISEEAKPITIGDPVQITNEFWVFQKLLDKSKFPEAAKHIDGIVMKKTLGY